MLPPLAPLPTAADMVLLAWTQLALPLVAHVTIFPFLCFTVWALKGTVYVPCPLATFASASVSCDCSTRLLGPRLRNWLHPYPDPWHVPHLVLCSHQVWWVTFPSQLLGHWPLVWGSIATTLGYSGLNPNSVRDFVSTQSLDPLAWVLPPQRSPKL